MNDFYRIVSHPVDDPEFDRACWSGTLMLVRRRKYFERLANNPVLPICVRVDCWEDALALREELAPC